VSHCFYHFDSTENAEVPTKCISSVETLELRANIIHIDFEGRSDGDSMRKIISQMKPRQLVIIKVL
jgi:cleavage and polyadenylation specificity factor subunit 2